LLGAFIKNIKCMAKEHNMYKLSIKNIYNRLNVLK